MKFEIINRTNELTPPFRQKLLKLLSIHGQQLILGYGYLDENMIDDDFIKNMKLGFNGISNPEIIIIGKHGSNSSCNFNSYMQTYQKIKRSIPHANVRLLIAKKENYHKKVAIKSNKSYDSTVIPNICIIGSSNLTRPTFEDKYPYFNQELDIVFWRDISSKEIQEEKELECEQNELQLNYGVDVQVYWYLEKIYDDIKNTTDFVECHFSLYSDVPIDILIEKYNYIKSDLSVDEKGRKYLEQCYDKFLMIIYSKTVEELHDYFLRDSKEDDYLLITLRNFNYKFKGKLISMYLDDVLTINTAPF